MTGRKKVTVGAIALEVIEHYGYDPAWVDIVDTVAEMLDLDHITDEVRIAAVAQKVDGLL